MRLVHGFAAVAVTLASASPASAQSVPPSPPVASSAAQADARGVVLQPLTLTKINDLDFGTIIGSSTAGNVTIDADTGARAVTGGVVGVPSYPGNRGLFGGAGTANQAVVLSLTAPTLLVSTTNPSDTILVNRITLDQGNALNRTIGATSAFFVGVGGDFAIGASQPSGLYRAQFNLTADYQ